MARKTFQNNIHEFTRQIHSTKRRGTRYANMINHNEKEAKYKSDNNIFPRNICCKDCRYFHFGCSDYIGIYHKSCNEFQMD